MRSSTTRTARRIFIGGVAYWPRAGRGRIAEIKRIDDRSQLIIYEVTTAPNASLQRWKLHYHARARSFDLDTALSVLNRLPPGWQQRLTLLLDQDGDCRGFSTGPRRSLVLDGDLLVFKG